MPQLITWKTDDDNATIDYVEDIINDSCTCTVKAIHLVIIKSHNMVANIFSLEGAFLTIFDYVTRSFSTRRNKISV